MRETNFFERLKQNPRPVVVDFWAPWCGPCRLIEPVLKRVGVEYDGKVDVWKINSDEQPEILRALGIYGIPTMVAFHDGQVVARSTGVGSPAVLSNLFESALSGEKKVNFRPAPLDRLLRLVAGGILLFLAFQGHFSGLYLILAGLGVVAVFSAVYDRCPVYRAISGRIKAWLNKEKIGQAGS